MGSNVKRITMAKRESIVPGLGKKQAIVFNNREARQLEHKRHVQELGFPEEQDKHGRPEEEGASLRYAPVSYDDETPTPSKIVNQAGQDLGQTNRNPVMFKEDVFDMKSVVRDVMKDVPIQKDVISPLTGQSVPTAGSGASLAKLAKIGGPLLKVLKVGARVGAVVGAGEGAVVGLSVGDVVGRAVGCVEGEAVGLLVA